MITTLSSPSLVDHRVVDLKVHCVPLRQGGGGPTQAPLRRSSVQAVLRSWPPVGRGSGVPIAHPPPPPRQQARIPPPVDNRARTPPPAMFALGPQIARTATGKIISVNNLTYPPERRITYLNLHRTGKLYGGFHVLPVYKKR